MNKIILTLLILGISGLSALGYASNRINKYFSNGEVYYRGVVENGKESRFMSSKVSSSRCVNIQVFDLNSGVDHKVFEQELGADLSIIDLVFENKKKEQNRLYLSDSSFRNHSILESPKDRMIIVVYHSKNETKTLWSTNSLGRGLEKVTELSDLEDWHIDTTNQKIRVLTSIEGGYQMREYPW